MKRERMTPDERKAKQATRRANAVLPIPLRAGKGIRRRGDNAEDAILRAVLGDAAKPRQPKYSAPWMPWSLARELANKCVEFVVHSAKKPSTPAERFAERAAAMPEWPRSLLAMAHVPPKAR